MHNNCSHILQSKNNDETTILEMTHQILTILAKIDGFSRTTRYNVNLKIKFYIYRISRFVKTITNNIVETQKVRGAPK